MRKSGSFLCAKEWKFTVCERVEAFLECRVEQLNGALNSSKKFFLNAKEWKLFLCAKEWKLSYVRESGSFPMCERVEAFLCVKEWKLSCGRKSGSFPMCERVEAFLCAKEWKLSYV